MKQYTQSNLDPGNCWQTAVACCIEVEPDLLPPQCELEDMAELKFRQGDDGPHERVFDGWGSYSNILTGYLQKHHGLQYATIYVRSVFDGIEQLKYPYHVMTGPTIRTAAYANAAGKRHVNHAVVALNGVVVFDPHPSRAGLLPDHDDQQWGIFAPQSKVVSAYRESKANEPGYQLVFGCLCPACHLDEARAKAKALIAKFDLLASAQTEIQFEPPTAT